MKPAKFRSRIKCHDSRVMLSIFSIKSFVKAPKIRSNIKLNILFECSSDYSSDLSFLSDLLLLLTQLIFMQKFFNDAAPVSL